MVKYVGAAEFYKKLINVGKVNKILKIHKEIPRQIVVLNGYKGVVYTHDLRKISTKLKIG